MSLYALENILLDGREFVAGEELPSSLEDSVIERLKDRDLVSSSKRKAKNAEEGAEAEHEEPETRDEPPNFSSMNKDQLEAEALARGLDADGNKADLIERLDTFEAESPT